MKLKFLAKDCAWKMARTTRNLALLLLSLFALANVAAASTAADEASPDRLRLGVVTAGDDEIRERVEPFRLALEEIADLPVDLFLIDTLGDAVEALASGKIDYARLSSSAYAATHHLCGCVEPLVTAGPDGFPARFYAILVTRRDAEKTTLEDLRGAKLAVGGREAVAGYRLPVTNLAAEGINVRTYFGSMTTFQDPLEGLQAVVAGKVHAATGWSTLAGAPESGYTAGTLNDFYVSGARDFEHLQIVWRSGPVPYSAHTLRSDLPDALKRRVRAGLMDLRLSAPDAYSAIEPDLPGGFEPVSHADYRPLLLTYDDAFVAVLENEN